MCFKNIAPTRLQVEEDKNHIAVSFIPSHVHGVLPKICAQVEWRTNLYCEKHLYSLMNNLLINNLNKYEHFIITLLILSFQFLRYIFFYILNKIVFVENLFHISVYGSLYST